MKNLKILAYVLIVYSTWWSRNFANNIAVESSKEYIQYFFSFTISYVKSHAYALYIFRKFNFIRKYFICLIFCECMFVAFCDFRYSCT